MPSKNTLKITKENKELEQKILKNRTMLVEQPKPISLGKGMFKKPTGVTYRRKTFIKKIDGKERTFANRAEYKEFRRSQERKDFRETRLQEV